MDGENTLDPYAVGNFSHGEHGAVAATRHADNSALENLGALLFAFDNLDVNTHGFARAQRRRFFFDLFRLELADNSPASLLVFASSQQAVQNDRGGGSDRKMIVAGAPLDCL
jgi:hypothetical protein